MLRVLFGERDPRYTLAADRLADAHEQNGDHAGAMQLYRKLLDAMSAGLGVGHPGYQLTLRKFADGATENEVDELRHFFLTSQVRGTRPLLMAHPSRG